MAGKSTAALTIVSPVAEYQDVDRSRSSHAVRRGMAGKRALLLPAEKSSSPPFVDALARRMAAGTSVRSAFVRNPDWAFFHPQRAESIDAEVDALARECDLVVSGVAY